MKTNWDSYDPDKWDEALKRDAFRQGRHTCKTFKPLPIAPVHLVRCCGNCKYNKGSPIHEFNEFSEYGLSFYYGFLACTLNGRTADKCMVTDTLGVCKHHKFDEVLKGHMRDMPKPLKHLSKCIKEREGKIKEVENE